MTLVARASERSALTTLFDDARVGMSGALVVYGDAGIGKSAVLDLACGPGDRLSGLPLLRR